MNARRQTFKIEEAAEAIGIGETVLVRYIEREWVIPADPEAQRLDQLDLARAQLIHELLTDFGSNEESISVILHLLDQIKCLRSQLEERSRLLHENDPTSASNT